MGRIRCFPMPGAPLSRQRFFPITKGFWAPPRGFCSRMWFLHHNEVFFALKTFSARENRFLQHQVVFRRIMLFLHLKVVLEQQTVFGARGVILPPASRYCMQQRFLRLQVVFPPERCFPSERGFWQEKLILHQEEGCASRQRFLSR